ncbi:MAG: Hsp20/alpha crystallin family protein [Spirochaetota bacterium]|nr:Hsp20/alpha crystallin family protein [Spirochaetota bacterium]
MPTSVTKIKKDAYDNPENVIVPLADIYETENEYVIKADMPGIKKENVDITINDNILEIKGTIDESVQNQQKMKYSEYKLHNYHRSFTVGNNIDSNKISANMDNGVLTLSLTKKEEAKPKKIAIEVN